MEGRCVALEWAIGERADADSCADTIASAYSEVSLLCLLLPNEHRVYCALSVHCTTHIPVKVHTLCNIQGQRFSVTLSETLHFSV